MKTAPTARQEADATLFQETVTTFYSAFDYLEITADGRYNFHQPGDPSGSCVWCGTWSFNKSSLWLKLDSVPRLDIYAKDGDIQMTYTAEPDKKSKYTWLVSAGRRWSRRLVSPAAAPNRHTQDYLTKRSQLSKAIWPTIFDGQGTS